VGKRFPVVTAAHTVTRSNLISAIRPYISVDMIVTENIQFLI
jgi:hypothetical protein